MVAYHGGPMLRVLTANLYNGGADPSAFGQLLDRVDPDVVAAQELSSELADVIGARFDHGLLAPSDDYKGMGLVSRSPLAVERVSLPHRDAFVGPTGVTVWCVHPANPTARSPAIRARRAQVRGIADRLASTSGPTLLVGDLNATPSWPAYRRLRQHLDDGVADWARRNGRRPNRTWGLRPWWPAVLRIDHALVRDLAVLDTFTIRVPGSDHRALVVDVA